MTNSFMLPMNKLSGVQLGLLIEMTETNEDFKREPWDLFVKEGNLYGYTEKNFDLVGYMIENFGLDLENFVIKDKEIL